MCAAIPEATTKHGKCKETVLKVKGQTSRKSNNLSGHTNTYSNQVTSIVVPVFEQIDIQTLGHTHTWTDTGKNNTCFASTAGVQVKWFYTFFYFCKEE